MKKTIIASVVAGCLGASFATLAQDSEPLSYTYLQADYINQDVDLFEDDDLLDNFIDDFDDGNGFGFQGSYLFAENLFAFGGYSESDVDFTFVTDTGQVFSAGEDINVFEVGLGFRAPMAEKTDLVLRGSYIDVDVGDFSFGANENDNIDDVNDIEDAFDDLNEDSTDGFAADINLRSQLTGWLEGNVGVRYTDLDTGDDFSFVGGLLYEFTPNMGINVSVDAGDELRTYRAGFRYSF